MENDLQVIEQKTVEFYNDELVAVRVQGGTVYVPIRPICDMLDISWPSQRNRIHRDEVLAQEVKNISIFITNTQGSTEGQHREVLCLPLEFVSGFLFGINATRVKPEVKSRLLRYQRECYKVLSEAFFEGRLSPDTDFETLLQNTDNPAVQAYKTFQALAKLARHQLILESRIDKHEERLEQLESVVGDTRHYITPSQSGITDQPGRKSRGIGTG